MAHYTTQVRTICETVAGLSDSVGYNGVETVLNESWDKILQLFPYTMRRTELTSVKDTPPLLHGRDSV